MRVCIAYASKRGSTRKMAEIMADEISGKVDVAALDMEKNPDMSGCELIVLGVPIYYEKPLPALRKTVEDNDGFRDRKVALFIMCIASRFGSRGVKYSENRYVRLSEEGIEGDIIATKVFHGWILKEDAATLEEGRDWIKRVIKAFSKGEHIDGVEHSKR